MAGDSRGGGGTRRDNGSSVPRAGTDWRERFTTIACFSGIVPASPTNFVLSGFVHDNPEIICLWCDTAEMGFSGRHTP